MPHWKASGRWSCVRGSRGHAAPAELAPRPGESVVEKTFFSGFSAEALAAAIAEARADTVVLAGVHLHGCVRATALDAYAAGLDVWIAEDATASDDPLHAAVTRRYLDGRAARFASVEELAARFAWITPSTPLMTSNACPRPSSLGGRSTPPAPPCVAPPIAPRHVARPLLRRALRSPRGGARVRRGSRGVVGVVRRRGVAASGGASRARGPTRGGDGLPRPGDGGRRRQAGDAGEGRGAASGRARPPGGRGPPVWTAPVLRRVVRTRRAGACPSASSPRSLRGTTRSAFPGASSHPRSPWATPRSGSRPPPRLALRSERWSSLARRVCPTVSSTSWRAITARPPPSWRTRRRRRVALRLLARGVGGAGGVRTTEDPAPGGARRQQLRDRLVGSGPAAGGRRGRARRVRLRRPALHGEPASGGRVGDARRAPRASRGGDRGSSPGRSARPGDRRRPARLRGRAGPGSRRRRPRRGVGRARPPAARVARVRGDARRARRLLRPRDRERRVSRERDRAGGDVRAGPRGREGGKLRRGARARGRRAAGPRRLAVRRRRALEGALPLRRAGGHPEVELVHRGCRWGRAVRRLEGVRPRPARARAREMRSSTARLQAVYGLGPERVANEVEA